MSHDAMTKTWGAGIGAVVQGHQQPLECNLIFLTSA